MTAVAIGVDLGGTKVAVGAVDDERRVLYSSQEASTGLGSDLLLETIVRQVSGALEARPDAVGCGLGIPSRIDRERGVSIEAVNLELSDVPVRDIVAERVGIPVFVDNDGNAAALAEHRFGAARSARNAIVLTIGTGIGGGLIIDGDVYRGSTGSGAELGHVVVDADGPRCQGNCPNRGCVEAVASGTALGREGRLAAERSPGSALGGLLSAGEPIDGRAVTEAGLAGDEVAIEVLALIGGRIGVALSSLANIFEPDVIVLGGGAMRAGELLLEPARKVLRERALRPQNGVPVVAAELGPEAGMIGAAAMAMIEAPSKAPARGRGEAL